MSESAGSKAEIEVQFFPQVMEGKGDQMVVRTLGNGREVTGIYIGAQNARRHFPREKKHIELLLGHLQIHCDLSPEFWKGRPEICDRRLGAWLFSRFFHGKASRAPMPIELVPTGDDVYRLAPVSLPAASSNGLSRIGPSPAVMHAEKDATKMRSTARAHH
jgi:hypothetical protein